MLSNDIYQHYSNENKDLWSKKWRGRARDIGEIIKNMFGKANFTMLDVGCGYNTLQEHLQQAGCNFIYYSTDIIKRTDETIVYDFNHDDTELLPAVDIITMLGAAEYAIDLQKVLAALLSKSNHLIFTYRSRWKNVIRPDFIYQRTAAEIQEILNRIGSPYRIAVSESGGSYYIFICGGKRE